MTAAIVCSDLSFTWPDGTRVFSGLSLAIGPGRTGLIGVNGSGKSTLLRLIAGELRPGGGAIRATGDVGYLPQTVALGTRRTVSDLLGITAARGTLHAIEAGETGEDAFAAIGDDWDVEERAGAWLDRLGLAHLGLDDRVERLSGGETIGVALAALFLRRPDIVLLDEPQAARDRLEEAERAVRDDAAIRVALPATAVPAGRTVLTVTGLAGARWHPATGTGPAEADDPGVLADLILRGPERLALIGPNGSGKTTLLKAIAGLAPRPGVTVRLGAVTGYLPQRLDILDDALTVVDNVRAAAPAASVNEVRASLARFLFRGERADRLAGTLSGGERFRAVLAALLLAQPAPQLLLLDEPTNNLDMASVRQLAQALEGYRGAIIVASHDVPFLRSAGLTGWLRLDRDTGLTISEPL